MTQIPPSQNPLPQETETRPFAAYTFADFTAALASKAPVPGGGGASAFAGALAAALGRMVGALTVGKKKYAPVESALRGLMEKAEALRLEFLDLADQDAEAFRPLAAAYALPAGTEEEKREKQRVMETRLRGACAVPLRIMERSGEMLEALKEFAGKGAAIALSDAGAGAILCKAALLGASLNVFINTRAMTNREEAAALNLRARGLIETYGKEADEIYAAVRERLEEGPGNG